MTPAAPERAYSTDVSATRVGWSRQVGPALLVSGAKVVGGISVIAINLWIARELPPAVYGVFAVAVTVLLLLDGVLGAALDAAVIGSLDDEPGPAATRAERAGLLIKLGAGVGAGVVVTGAVALAGSVSMTSLAALVVSGGTGLLVHRSTLAYFQIRQRFGAYALIDLALTAARWLAVGTALAAGVDSAAGLLAAYGLIAWLSSPLALRLLNAPCTGAASGTADSALATVWQRARVALATTSVGAIVARLDILMIAAVAGTREAGLFSAASTLALAPMWLGAYLAPAFTARILPYCRDGRMAQWLRGVQAALIVLAVAGVIVGVMIGPILMAQLLPIGYSEAERVFTVLLLAGAAGFVTFPVVLHTLLFLSPRTYLVMDLVSLPILVAAYVIAGQRAGALGFAWVTACAALTKACIAQFVAASVVQREQTRLADIGAFSSAGVAR